MKWFDLTNVDVNSRMRELIVFSYGANGKKNYQVGLGF